MIHLRLDLQHEIYNRRYHKPTFLNFLDLLNVAVNESTNEI